MAQRILREPVRPERGQPIIGKNSVQFSEADPVSVDDSTGFLTISSAGQGIYGFATRGVTMASDNQTSAKVKPEYIPAEGVEVLYPSDSDCSQDKLNGYKDFSTASTGGYVVGLTNITGGQVKVIAFDPFDESDNDAVVVTVSEPQKLAFAQA